jgi:signal transduction histidine kinase
LPVELSGLPLFDRDRNFRGYRGFGVCRDLAPMRRPAQPSDGAATAPQHAPVDDSAATSPPHADSPNETDLNDVAAVASDDPQEANQALANVVPFRPAAPADPKTTLSLTPVERRAFRELAQELNSRLRAGPAPAAAEVIAEHLAAASQNHAQALSQEELRQVVSQALNRENGDEFGERPSEDLMEEPGEGPSEEASEEHCQKKHEATEENNQKRNEEQSQAESKESSNEHDDASSEQPTEAPTPVPGRMIEPALLDRVPVAVLVYRHDELIYANRPFFDLSGYGDLPAIEAAGGLNALFAEPSDTFADTAGSKALAIVTQSGERLPVEGRMFTVPWNASPAIALILTKNQSDAASAASTRNPVEALATAKRETERAIATKAEFVARISHEIRNQLNAITGFAEAIMTERFGPIGNERYREYVKNLHAAAAHLSSMVDDLFDLSKLESGRIDLTFAKVNLNELTQQCVGIMQPQANRARIIIRSALTSGLPLVDADEKALRQIVLNLLSNSIKFTGPGGQIIVSTVFSDAHEAVLRVRDTGIGMNEKQIEAALAPFPDVGAWASSGSGAAGFGLPLTKALTEANHAHFGIKSAPDAGTLIEITFPTSHTAAA